MSQASVYVLTGARSVNHLLILDRQPDKIEKCPNQKTLLQLLPPSPYASQSIKGIFISPHDLEMSLIDCDV